MIYRSPSAALSLSDVECFYVVAVAVVTDIKYIGDSQSPVQLLTQVQVRPVGRFKTKPSFSAEQ